MLEYQSYIEVPDLSLAQREVQSPKKAEVIPEEAVERARKVIERTLEGADSTYLASALRARAKTLPQYQDLQKSLADIPKEALPEALYHKLHTIKSQPIKDGPEDGVLISSIRQGSLCCAGRTLLASTFLQEKGIQHSIISTIAGEGGHSVLLIEISDETRAYCDAENGLYFTFPTAALTARENENGISMMHLGDFTPRKNDVCHGLSSISRTFMTMDADTGVTHQYLGNVQAALNGNTEFKNSNIPTDELSAKAISVLQREYLGPKVDTLERFSDELYVDGIARQKEKDDEMHSLVKTVFADSHGNEQEFYRLMVAILPTHPVMVSLFPYLQNASKEKRWMAAQQAWKIVKNQG